MGAASRNKGKAGEREVAALIRDLTGWDVRRRVRQHDGDSDLEGVPGWAIEVKRHARALRSDIAAWWAQAIEQAVTTQATPALFYRANRDEWRAVWPLGIHLGANWLEYVMTCEGSIEAWAAVAREHAGPELGLNARSTDAPSATIPAMARLLRHPSACPPTTLPGWPDR